MHQNFAQRISDEVKNSLHRHEKVSEFCRTTCNKEYQRDNKLYSLSPERLFHETDLFLAVMAFGGSALTAHLVL